jgi:hypothetical protein
MQTPYQIAAQCEHLDDRANIVAINKLFRKQDQSHLWPVCNRFGATERAIRRVRRLNREGAGINPGLEYALAVDAEISRIVNAD